ncbi:MAG: 2'-5' RNA ligase family protein [Flavobacteriales bacterium]|nr:2'-5' RNA ligase family protein [Flavobacteriales bacterium]
MDGLLMSMLHRFLLTILPSPALSAEVQRLRVLLHPAIGSFSGRNTPPHITLCFLDLPEAHESAVIEAIARGTYGQQPFTLHYHGITHFPDKRTIYIDPVEKDAIASVRVPIVDALKNDSGLSEALRETDHPHLTIAAGLKPAQFEKAWAMLAPHELQSDERVGEVVLLKRPLQPGTTYEPVRSFPLG